MYHLEKDELEKSFQCFVCQLFETCSCSARHVSSWYRSYCCI